MLPQDCFIVEGTFRLWSQAASQTVKHSDYSILLVNDPVQGDIFFYIIGPDFGHCIPFQDGVQKSDFVI